MTDGPDGARYRAPSAAGPLLVWVLPGLVDGRARKRVADEISGMRAWPASVSLAAVVDGGVSDEGRPWTARLDRGRTLADLLARGGPLPLDDVADMAADVAHGLATIAAAGASHGGLRPSAVVFDGGRAAVAEPVPTTAVGQVPPLLDGCTAPEVLEGRSGGVAGDAYGLAAVVAWALTGRPPWSAAPGEDAGDVLLRLLADPAPDLHGASLPGPVLAAVTAGLSPDPGARPSPTALAAVLAEAAATPAVAPVPSPVPTGERPTAPPTATLAVPTGRGTPLGSRYVLEDRIGRGAMGEVWRATRRDGGPPVAVKILRPDLTDDHDLVARFIGERSTLVALDHPNLVRVHDLVVDGQTIAFVLDLVDGPDLRRYLAGRGSLPPALACDLLAQLADGLAAVHEAGVVHRDLKPENVLLAQEDIGVRALLTDFGIAHRATGRRLTVAGQLLGTPDYLAPEVGAGEPATAASDVYALGVIGYELLCGRRPFGGDGDGHPAAVLRAHAEQAPPRPPGLDARLWAVLESCLAKPARSRPAAARVAEQLHALTTALAGQPALPPFEVAPAAAAPAGAPPGAEPDAGDPVTVIGQALPARPAPPTAPSRARSWVLAALGLLGISLAVGVGLALLTNPDPPSTTPNTTVDSTPAVPFERVFLRTQAESAGAGEILLRFEAASGEQGFLRYELLEVVGGNTTNVAGTIPAGATSTRLRGLPPGGGERCFVVVADFEQGSPVLAQPGPGPLTTRSCAVPGVADQEAP